MVDMKAIADELKTVRAEKIERKLRSKEDAKLIVPAAFDFTIQDVVDNIITDIRRDFFHRLRDLGKMENQLAVAYVLCASDNFDNSMRKAMEGKLMLRLTEEFNKINVPELLVKINRVEVGGCGEIEFSRELGMCRGHNLASFLVENYPQYFKNRDEETLMTWNMEEIVETGVYVHFDAVLT